MQGSKYLECLTRHGLDARVLLDYKHYGIIYVSKRNKNGTADIEKFLDYTGFNINLIERIIRLENSLNIEIYHIIQNNENELVLMLHDNGFDIKYQLSNLKYGESVAVVYKIQEDSWEYVQLHHQVKLGAVIDKDYEEG